MLSLGTVVLNSREQIIPYRVVDPCLLTFVANINPYSLPLDNMPSIFEANASSLMLGALKASIN